MLICFDIGNTNIVLGIVDNDTIKETYRFVTNANLTSDEYYQKVKGILENITIDGVIISSVVPSLDMVFDLMIKKHYNVNPIFVGPGIKSGIKLKIENPKSLGADLLCDAVGAVNKYLAPVIVVDLGTATKFIVVNERNEYLGGAIAPGMNGSLNSLIASAAKLSHTALVKPDNVIGNDTITCIQSGMIYGTASMIDGMLDRIKEQLSIDNLKVVLTGGLSPLIKDCLKSEVIFNPNILLEGLIYLYNRNLK